MHGAFIKKKLYFWNACMSSLYHIIALLKHVSLKKIENRERAMGIGCLLMYHEKITICVNSLNPKKGKEPYIK